MTDTPPRYSHPETDSSRAVPLKTHLCDVANRIDIVVPEDAQTGGSEPLRDVARRVALVHDFAKLTTWFQQHIGEFDGTPEPKELSHHSLLGALLAYYVLESTGHDETTCFAGFVAVLRHHGRLPNVAEHVFERTSWNESDRKNREQTAAICQIENIDANVPDQAADIVEMATDGDGSWDEFSTRVTDHSLFEDVREHVTYPFDPNSATSEPISNHLYADTVRLWSALTLADKTSAASRADDELEADAYAPGEVPTETLVGRIEELQETAEQTTGHERTLNDLRKEARTEVLENLTEEIEVATLTLPTGFGKTLTGMNAALELRDRTNRERVVYALPFTSIIDQVGEELSSIFDSDGRDDRLTLHHHLSEAVRELGDSDLELESDARARIETMLGESWRAGIVLTTFVQLFESLAGPRNTQSMKLPALHDSIVVLDEPQALPHEWWPLIRRLVRLLVDDYDAAVIAMTATQPRLFDRPTTPLVECRERYFTAVERVSYSLDQSVTSFPGDDTLDHATAAERILNTEESALAICNTIDSTQSLTEEILERSQTVSVGNIFSEKLVEHGVKNVDGDLVSDAVEERSGRPELHLSTRLRPRDRLTLLETATKLTEHGVPLIVVSTQLIEAGVDISFDRVFRDFAPMDSIVQAAGRCNRSFEHERGRVTVWRLGVPEGVNGATPPGEAVYNRYGESRLSLTKNALDTVRDGATEISGPMLAVDAVDEYYDLIDDANPGKSELTELVDDAKIEQLGQQSLISQRRAVDVVICRTERDRERIEKVRRAWGDGRYGDIDDCTESLRKIQVSVPIYDPDSAEANAVEKLPPLYGSRDDTDLRVLDTANRRFEDYFDSTTGLLIDDSVEARFL